MGKFKVGQTVYYYLDSNDFCGGIIACKINKATKNLATGEVTYVVGSGIHWIDGRELTADYLYSSKKQIIKEHKDEIAYGVLKEKLDSIKQSLDRIVNEYADKMTANPLEWRTISATETTTKLYVDGIGDVQEEFDKLKKEVENLKKKIKKSTKKSVKKEGNK